MIFTSHRINSISDLLETPIEFGVEVDLRDIGNKIIMSHDPFLDGIDFEDFLKEYNHSFIILNIKSERIEYKVLELMKEYKINNYFLLDSSFPMIYKLSSETNKIAIRYSEFESLETVLSLKDKVKWVWVDCFTKFPLDINSFKLLKDSGFKICIVSPELQNRSSDIIDYALYMKDNEIIPDMICTKIYNIEKWKKIFN